MPAYLNSNPSSYDQQPHVQERDVEPSVKFRDQSGKSLHIGLINNMPDGALEATERQFLSLLNAASDGIEVCLSLYSLPGVPRNEIGAERVRNFYTSAENLLKSHSDTHLDENRSRQICRTNHTGTALPGFSSGLARTPTRPSGPAWPRTPQPFTWMASPESEVLTNTAVSSIACNCQATH